LSTLLPHNKAVWKSCQNLTGSLLGHVDTTSYVRDIEAVRAALGKEKLNFFGASYGTQVGAQYAELFPENFRTMAWDGMLDHSDSSISAVVTEDTAYEPELKRFFSWCSDSEDCALYGQNATQIFLDLVDSADETPIPAPYCSVTQACRLTVTGEDILFSVQGLLHWKNPIPPVVTGWPGFALALQEAVAGNATLLSPALATSEDSYLYAGAAILCNDWRHNIDSLADLKYINEIASYTSPLTKGASQFYLAQVQCIGFPYPASNPQRKHMVTSKTPILMANSKYDPSTSIVWAEGVRSQIDNSVLVVREGDGHTLYNLGGEAHDIMEAYLVNKTLPAQNTVVQS
jgi:pimeloyl-ACP methyl ester carboxylesterase